MIIVGCAIPILIGTFLAMFIIPILLIGKYIDENPPKKDNKFNPINEQPKQVIKEEPKQKSADEIYADAQKEYKEKLKCEREERERKKKEKIKQEREAKEKKIKQEKDFEEAQRKRIVGDINSGNIVDITIINTNDTPESYIVGVETKYERKEKQIDFVPGNSKHNLYIILDSKNDVGKCKVYYKRIMHYENNLPMFRTDKTYYSDNLIIDCDDLPWNEVNENTKEYNNRIFKIKGNVLQIINNGILLCTLNKKYNTVYISDYKNKISKSVFTGEYIEILGYCDDRYYYHTTDNKIISVPKIDPVCNTNIKEL